MSARPRRAGCPGTAGRPPPASGYRTTGSGPGLRAVAGRGAVVGGREWEAIGRVPERLRGAATEFDGRGSWAIRAPWSTEKLGDQAPPRPTLGSIAFNTAFVASYGVY